MDDDGATQPATQQVLDPRRLGRDESGMTEDDHSDIICILHPCSPASYRIVQQTSRLAPQHVLQSHSTSREGLSQSPSPEEAETFVLDRPGGASDLALRLSSRLSKPYLGFLFGRSPALCDIVCSTDNGGKRLSNTHFRIYLNEDGIIMLEDMSTNGTMVDTCHLRAKGLRPDLPATRMLNHLSSIDILSPKPDESIKFIVRIPSRAGYEEEYMRRLNEWLVNFNLARQHCGMHWDGGTEYNVISLLGKGAFATVYKLATAMDGKLFAAKELEKKRFLKNGFLDHRLDNEMKIMRSLRHPNIVQYIDYRDVGKHLYIIMEFVPHGDLQGYLSEHTVLPEEHARQMACQVLNSLAYLHSRNITHRDIKPDNILIASLNPFTVKLSDFGLSKVVSNAETFLKTFCGTLLYCAPEVFPQYDTYPRKGIKRRRQTAGSKKAFHSYSQSVDIWSFAAVLWFSLAGKPPFEGVMDQTGNRMFEKIMGTRLDTEPLRAKGISDAAIDLLVKMLNTDPSQRPTEQECLAHPWLAGLQQGRVPQRPKEEDLKAIPEEDEEPVETEEKLSQLSIYGLPDDKDGDPNSNEEDRAFDAAVEEEVDIEPDEFDFINPRQIKRIRHLLVPRDQPRNGADADSSPEMSPYRRPGQKNGGRFLISQDPVALGKARQRLFGEIGQSTLNSSGFPGGRSSRGQSKEGDQYDTLAQRVSLFGTPTKPGGNQVETHSSRSLMGAETMIKELNMDSPQSPGSPSEPASEPHTPGTPDRSHELHNLPGKYPETPLASFAGAGAGKPPSYLSETSQQATPKAPVVFSRRISIPKTASYYWDPHDPSTHNLEYSTKVSGHDFVGEAARADSECSDYHDAKTDDEANEQPVEHDEEAEKVPTFSTPSRPPPLEFLRPPPRLGTLTATRDSFAIIVLRLEERFTSWGRLNGNTIVYTNTHDTRIPKQAFMLWFHAPGIVEAEREGRDWTKLDNLRTFISTRARNGIYVNDTKLMSHSRAGAPLYGCLQSGDVITVFAGGKDAKGMKFFCEIFWGEGATARMQPFRTWEDVRGG
ncbi:Pkinase-domain-containing protein [Saccharata proteae CBS 121410]|uniref:non-specific serine/threonine protein kinase n=1 Tax=Saccharata proteae CBS 121410 TaxID=1314787 RepID=A0A9P4HTC1_9PEZI|nr:Pkinase-domain-containing protein [Saccharata proteae CBS 121410]